MPNHSERSNYVTRRMEGRKEEFGKVSSYKRIKKKERKEKKKEENKKLKRIKKRTHKNKRKHLKTKGFSKKEIKYKKWRIKIFVEESDQKWRTRSLFDE